MVLVSVNALRRDSAAPKLMATSAGIWRWSRPPTISAALAGPAALVARLSHSRFGLAVFDTLAEPVEDIRARLHTPRIPMASSSSG